MTRTTDPARASPASLRAVLFGTATQTDQERSNLDSIPQVANNLRDLEMALSEPHGLFPAGSIEVLQDRISAQDVYQVIGKQPRTGTLLCYFAGHGLNADGRLCLALPGSIDRKPDQRSTSLPVEALLDQLIQHKNRRVILILDCCFAGLAFREPAASDVHLLVAVGKASKAKYLGPRHTVFTGALLNVLKDGVPDGSQFVDLDTLYRQIRLEILQHEDLSLLPHQRNVDDTGRFRLAPNRAYERVLTPAGLAARDEFAEEVGIAGDPVRAARLTADLLSDAYRSSLIGPGDLFYCRLKKASRTGACGDAEGAVRQLEDLLSEAQPSDNGSEHASGHAGNHGSRHASGHAGVSTADLDMATQSLKYWRNRT